MELPKEHTHVSEILHRCSVYYITFAISIGYTIISYCRSLATINDIDMGCSTANRNNNKKQ